MFREVFNTLIFQENDRLSYRVQVKENHDQVTLTLS